VAAPLTLYVDAFWSSPFDFSAFVALVEKGLEFHAVRALLREGQGTLPAYRERTITARVPALAHGEVWIAESQAIVEYLDEAFPAPHWPRVLPEAPAARARARQVMSFVRSELPALRVAIPSERIFYPRGGPLALAGEAADEATELEEVARRLLADPLFRPWSIAYADLAFALSRLELRVEPLAPDLAEFLARERARPSVRAYFEHPRPPRSPSEC
jgi:glutathione S-transferase